LSDAETAAAVGSRGSNGLRWAWTSFGVDVLETLILLQVVLFDKPEFGVAFHWGFLELYLLATVLLSLGQLTGIFLVIRGRYRLGGYFQIVSSGGQILKFADLHGILGVVGGVKALRFAESVEQTT
jgi:hypothetical protein